MTPARAYISVGSNIDRQENIAGALRALARRFGPLRCSRIYETPSEGFDGAPFYNLVVALRTDLPPQRLSAVLKAIEDEQGRRRDGPKFSSRTLDLDLILYDDLVLDVPGLSLPRDEIDRYSFVLGPLAEIAGERRHPGSGRTFAALWREMEPRVAPLLAVVSAQDLVPDIPYEDSP